MKAFSFSEWLESGGDTTTLSSVNHSYERMAWIYACVNRIATTASGAPLAFYRGSPNETGNFNSTDRITDPKDPVLQLFNPPKYPEIPSLKLLIFMTFVHLGIDGILYWVLNNKSGKLVDIDVKTKNQLSPIINKSGKLVGYKEDFVNTNTGQRLTTTYTVSQVIPINYYNPKNQFGGLSPLSACRLSVESEYSISGWNSAFFKVGMKSPLLLKSKALLTPDQKKDVKAEISNYYSGIDGGHGALLLQGNIDVEPLTVSPKDIDFVMGKKLNREEICAIYGVPPALVGIFEYANYANVREQIRIFWENTLLPKMNSILDLIQINILDRQFPGVYARWDLTEIPGLKPDPIELANAAKIYSDMGIPLEDVSRLLNMPFLNPEVFIGDYTPPSQRPQAAPAKPVQDQTQPEPTPPKKPKKQLELLNLLEVKLLKSTVQKFLSGLEKVYLEFDKIKDVDRRFDLVRFLVATELREFAEKSCSFNSYMVGDEFTSKNSSILEDFDKSKIYQKFLDCFKHLTYEGYATTQQLFAGLIFIFVRDFHEELKLKIFRKNRITEVFVLPCNLHKDNGIQKCNLSEYKLFATKDLTTRLTCSCTLAPVSYESSK